MRALPLVAAGALFTGGALLSGPADPALALGNGQAFTPPMGFNNWNAVHCNVTESFIKQTAAFIHNSGLQTAGYGYVNIDDCWALPNRDAAGNLVPDPAKFPDGIAGTAAFVHSLNLKLGLYNDSGTMTCSKSHGFPGSLGHERQDALQFARWGVDYLKEDDCNVPASGQTVSATIARYTAMRDALADAAHVTSRPPIVFSVCEKGDFGVPASAWPSIGNLWRTTFDVHPNWTRLDAIIAKNIPLASLAGHGAWNDPDMLEVGNAGLTVTEQQTQFSMWAEMAAPLLIGTDLTKATPTTLTILGNQEVIAIDQDALGKQGRQVSDTSGLRVLAKSLLGGDVAIAFFNETGSTAKIATTAAATGVPASGSYLIRDLWTHTQTLVSTSSWAATVPSHGTVLWRVHPAG